MVFNNRGNGSDLLVSTTLCCWGVCMHQKRCVLAKFIMKWYLRAVTLHTIPALWYELMVLLHANLITVGSAGWHRHTYTHTHTHTPHMWGQLMEWPHVVPIIKIHKYVCVCVCMCVCMRACACEHPQTETPQMWPKITNTKCIYNLWCDWALLGLFLMVGLSTVSTLWTPGSRAARQGWIWMWLGKGELGRVVW